MDIRVHDFYFGIFRMPVPNPCKSELSGEKAKFPGQLETALRPHLPVDLVLNSEHLRSRILHTHNLSIPGWRERQEIGKFSRILPDLDAPEACLEF